jgi:hypothetical protein
MAEKKVVDHRQDVLDTQEGPVYQANTLKGAQSGPHDQVDPNLYHTYTKPDGTTFVAPDSSREYYERKGYKVSGDEIIEDWVAWVEEKGKGDAPAEPKAKTTDDAPAYLPTADHPAPPVGTEPAQTAN